MLRGRVYYATHSLSMYTCVQVPSCIFVVYYNCMMSSSSVILSYEVCIMA